MKKIGKKLSVLTKIMLVFGLLISNLSSLSVVFADEVTLDVAVVDSKLNIKYLEELAEEVETVRVNVYENYTYLDETFENEVVNNYDLTSEELEMLVSLEEDEMLVVDTILSNVLFDGVYDVKVEIVDTTDVNNTDGEVLDTREISMEVKHKEGLELTVFDSATGLEIEALEDERYPVSYDSTKISVVAKLLAGGLNPTDMFYYDDQEYMASELLELPFTSDKDFNGYLYGEYILPVEVELLNADLEEVVYSSELNILYENYNRNTELLNAELETLELNDVYKFAGEEKDGILYVLLNEEKTNTMLDLYNLMNSSMEEESLITYVLSNSEYEDVLKAYDEMYNTNNDIQDGDSVVVVTEGEFEETTIEEFLESILLDDTVLLSLSNEGLTVTYKVVVVGDFNNDNVLNEEDLSGIIEQVIGNVEQNLEKSDVNMDGAIDTLDVMHLNQVIENKTWDVELSENEATFEARLEVIDEDIVSGDEFRVNYVLSVSDYAVNGISGYLNYDSMMVELVSVETSNDWLGTNNDGMFLYLGTESLTGTESLDENEEPVMLSNEYVIVTATFRALMSGTTTISIEEPEYFNNDVYYVVEDMEITTDVVINPSDNNNLKFLTIDGKNILEENVLDYEITVGNEVTTITVDAIPEIEGVTAVSIISPEELVEGANTITITVVAENGDEKVYTVTVIREEAPEEEVTTQVNYNDYNNYEDYEEEPEVVVTQPEEEPEEAPEEEEKSNLSRIIIIILILIVIAGLIYLIFKDEDDNETKKANKEVNKLKKDTKEFENKSNNNSKNKKNKNKKK